LATNRAASPSRATAATAAVERGLVAVITGEAGATGPTDTNIAVSAFAAVRPCG